MKHVFSIFLFIAASLFVTAQTSQSGYVKTKGRMDSNGKLIPGTRISGAAITLTGGHSTVSGADGSFTLTIPDKKYYLKNVQKKDYVLADPEMLSKQYHFSANPLVITMETPAQQLKDQVEAQKKIEATLRQQLQQREKELEELKNSNKITEDEYYQKLQHLYDEKVTENLVKEMSKRYATIDYDLIDSFQRQFSQYILNGELQKADSLLKTKGNLSADVSELQQIREANIIEREKLERRHLQLDSSISYAQWLMEDIAMRCYNKAEIFKLRYQYDSVAYYLELRAGLDTTNVEWLLLVGDVLKDNVLKDNVEDYEKALRYYQCALRQTVSQFGMGDLLVAYSYESIGDVYFRQPTKEAFSNDNCVKVSENYEKALEIYAKLLEGGEPVFSRLYHKLANLNFFFQNYYEAIDYVQKAMVLDRLLYSELSRSMASNYYFLADNYKGIGTLDKATEFYNKAIKVLKGYIDSLADNETNRSDLAASYKLLGDMYLYMDHVRFVHNDTYNEAVESYVIALDLYDSSSYEDCIQKAEIYDKMANLYRWMKGYSKSLNCLQNKLKIYQHIYGANHLKIAATYRDISSTYLSVDNYDMSIKYSLMELEQLMNVYGDLNHKKIMLSYCHIGDMYRFLGNYSEAEKYCLKALEVQKNISGERSVEYAEIVKKLGELFIDEDNKKTLKYYIEALNIYMEIIGENHSKVAHMYSHIADIYRRMGDYSASFDFHLKSLLLYKKIYEEDTGSNFARNSLGSQYQEIALLCADFEDYDNAIKYYQEGIDFYRRIHREDDRHSVWCYSEMGDLFFQLKNYSKSLDYYSELLDILQSSKQNVYMDILNCYIDIGSVYYSCGNHSKALREFEKADSLCRWIYGADCPKTKINSNNPVYMRDYVFIATTIEGETPAKAQGLFGEYIVLEYGDWTMDDTLSLFVKSNELKGQPKTILIMKDDVIFQHYFENTIGARLDLKQVGEREKQRVKELYHRWKKEQEE